MKSLIYSICLLILVSCATAPVTGRKQLILVSSSEMSALSAKQYDAFLSANPVSKDATQTATIKRVGKKIQLAAEKYMQANGLGAQLKNYNWQFNLVDDKTVNAWCMPGGRVVFYTGILPICQNETGIAVVMGHEVAHAIANHGAERMSQAMMAQQLGSALSGAMSSKPDLVQALFNQSVGVGTKLGLLKFSRDQESESDKIGLIFMAMAGYNPSEAPKFWERMQAASGQAPPEFLSTHPSNETRISDLKQQLPEALKIYQNNK